MSKLDVTLTINLSPETAKALASFGGQLERAAASANAAPNTKAKAAAPEADAPEEKSNISIADIKAKRGKKGKKAAEAEPEADEPSDDDELPEADEPDETDADDEGEADSEADGEDFEDESEAEETLDAKSLANLKKALGAYKGKHGMAKTVAVLKKHGKAERSDLVKPENLKALLAALKV